MVNYQYTYLIWSGVFLLIWLLLYSWRKNIRKEMLVISFLFGFAGILAEIVYVQDWWKPLTITGTLIGIEDFLIGFFIGGVAAVIYEEVYKKKVLIKKKSKIVNLSFLTLTILFIALFFGSFYILGISSFYSSVIAFGFGIFFILSKRRDLIMDCVISGFLMLTVGILIYFILRFIQPGFIEEFWYLENVWYANLFLGIPIAEYIWFFLAGAFIGPFYEYWKEGKLINIKK